MSSYRAAKILPSRRRFLQWSAASALMSPALAVRPAPRLTVLLVIEQFRPDYLDAARDQFIAGGFRRLFESGACFSDCRHNAASFSATTLATIATGAWPSMHGIVADSWYDRAARRPVRASQEALLGTTLAGEMAANPRTRVYAVGMDEARTRLFTSAPSASVFHMDARCQFATAGSPPEWLAAYNLQKPVENFHDAGWMAVGARSDAPPLRSLAYSSERPDVFATLYKASPYGQMAQFEFAAELVARERLGLGPTTDLLCLLAGSTELLGYDTGARSPLMHQMVLHLDRHLEFLFDRLTRSLGRNAFNLVLTGAHGAPPAPPQEARARMAVNGESFAQAIQKTLGPAGPKIEKYLYPFLSLVQEGPSRDPEPARLAAARAALAHPAVAQYYTAGGSCSLSGDFAARFRNSFHPRRSGDVMLAYRPEYVEEFGAGRGISYGSLYNYDCRVPLCFHGPQFLRRTFEEPVQTVDIAPTLARAMGVSAPSSSTGRILGEAFRKNVESE
jgi:hypothetical protein